MDAEKQTFDSELVEFFGELEGWSNAGRQRWKSSAPVFPSFNKRVVLESGVPFVIAQVLVFLGGRMSPGILALVLVALAAISMAVSFAFLITRVLGLTNPKFWSGLCSQFNSSDNYPFTPVRLSVERDLQTAARFARFSTPVVKAAKERLDADELELKERLAIGVGSPNVALLGTLIAGGWSAWENFQSRSGFFTVVLFAAAVALFALTVGLVRLRIQLIELTSCRALLQLVLTRRLMTTE